MRNLQKPAFAKCQSLVKYQDLGFRRLQCRGAHVLGTPDPPIPEVLLAYWMSRLSPGQYDHNIHKTTVLILVGVWRLSMSWRTSPLGSGCAFTLASPPWLYHGPCDHLPYDCSRITFHRGFGICDDTKHLYPGLAISRFPSLPDA